MKTTLYHGSSNEITLKAGTCMYFTPDIEVAKQYALGLNDLQEYNEMSFIYSIEIDTDDVVNEDDFMYFDCIGYQDYANMPNVVYNPESNYYCLKNIEGLELIENYENNL